MSSFLPDISAPSNIDYTEEMSPVRSQGTEGTCVAFAIAVGVKEWIEKKQNNFKELSPRYLYEKTKKEDEIPDDAPRCTPKGDGLYIQDALKRIQKYGVCEEKYWKYEECSPGNPQSGAEENAEQHKINVYAKLDTLDSIKKSLLVNGPCIAGVYVYSNWEKSWPTGEITMPGKSEFLGGHAICIVGYDDDKKYLKFKNSWGPEWGDNGYGYLPYEYMSLNGSEAWGITDLIIDPEPLIQSKEKVLEDLGIEFKDKSPEFKDFETTIKFH